MNAIISQRASIDQHQFSAAEVLQGHGQSRPEMVQLIDDNGVRNIICTRHYADDYVRSHPGWTLEVL